MRSLYHQSQPFDFPAMLDASTHNVDPGGVDAAVAQNVRQLGNVLFNAVKRPGEQLAQIVGKDLAGLHPRRFTELFHIRPDITPV